MPRHPPPDMDRRTALKSMAALAMTPWLARCGPAHKGGSPIDTVVHLMMENRSFDHVLGALALEGRPVDGLRLDMKNPHPAGGELGVYADDVACLIDPPHGWTASRKQFNGGLNDGFLKAYIDSNGEAGVERVMGYLAREDMPAHYAIADAGVVCDRWFAACMTSTWPNRGYSLCAQNGDYKGNDFANPRDYHTIFRRLEEAGLEWACYHQSISFLMLYPVARERMFPIEQFWEDAAAGRLPPYVYVEPLYGRASDHPPEHPLAGQIFISSVYDALSKSPQWKSTLFAVTYDEHGGFFDHVPPPKAADPLADLGWDQLGFRVPALVSGGRVSPGISSTVFDHTSVLATVARLYDLEPLTVRDAAAKDLLGLVDVEAASFGALSPAAQIPLIEVDEETLESEACSHDVPLGPRYVTGQPELERYVDDHPELSSLDRRKEIDQLFEGLLRRAYDRGLWRPKRTLLTPK